MLSSSAVSVAANLRALVILLATGTISVAAVACNGSTEAGNSAPSTLHGAVPPATSVAGQARLGRSGGYLKDDGDNDGDDEGRTDRVPNDDIELFARFGGEATPAQAYAIDSVVKRYLLAEAAADGRTACSLLSSSIAAGVASVQGRPGQSGGDTCTAAMVPLLRGQHQRLASEEVPTMIVTSVHARGDLALAALAFKAAPEGQIILEREGHIWKIDALFSNNLT